ncbi:hypothetical protein DJ68_08215 [Halorubrum sp. C3]|nr:hypothetical protein DJ68_08215 [Halorubrum sp. C3]
MTGNTIPVDWVRGLDEVTVWFWPDSPDPVTMRFPLRKWARIERKARDEHGGDVDVLLTEVLTADLEESEAASLG